MKQVAHVSTEDVRGSSASGVCLPCEENIDGLIVRIFRSRRGLLADVAVTPRANLSMVR